MMRVKGYLDGAVYDAVLTGDKDAPVQGSPRVAALVKQWTGRRVRPTPALPLVTVDPGDVPSLVALLSRQTQVTHIVDGDGQPGDAGVPPRRQGAVD